MLFYKLFRSKCIVLKLCVEKNYELYGNNNSYDDEKVV